MFEKEAKEYMHKDGIESEKLLNTIDLSLTKRQAFVLINICKQCFKDGAEFGYNKAKEWHYVKDGDLPKNNTQVLVLLENKRLKISIFMENKFTVWNKDYNTFTKLYNVIAWKEIVLPKGVGNV